jgi:hypothetical protein
MIDVERNSAESMAGREMYMMKWPHRTFFVFISPLICNVGLVTELLQIDTFGWGIRRVTGWIRRATRRGI